MPTVTANGIDIYYERSGSGPEAVVLQRLRLQPRDERSAHLVVHAALRRRRPRPARARVARRSRKARTRWPTTPPTRRRCSTRSAGSGAGSSASASAAWSPRSSRSPGRSASSGSRCSAPHPVVTAGASYPLHELAGLDAAERAAIGTRLLDTRFTPEWLAEHPGDQALVEMMAQRGTGPKSADQLRGEREQLDARRRHDVSDRAWARSPARRSSRPVATTGSRRRRTARRSRHGFRVPSSGRTKVGTRSSRRIPRHSPTSRASSPRRSRTARRR